MIARACGSCGWRNDTRITLQHERLTPPLLPPKLRLRVVCLALTASKASHCEHSGPVSLLLRAHQDRSTVSLWCLKKWTRTRTARRPSMSLGTLHDTATLALELQEELRPDWCGGVQPVWTKPVTSERRAARKRNNVSIHSLVTDVWSTLHQHSSGNCGKSSSFRGWTSCCVALHTGFVSEKI